MYGNQLQDSYLENPIDRGAWQATIHEESDVTEQAHAHTNTTVNFPVWSFYCGYARC